MKKLRYKNIFMYGSLQFCGNIEEYFSQNTEKLLVFIVMPRLKNKYNLLRMYKRKKIVVETKIWSSDNIFLYYTLWYLNYIKIIITNYKREEEFTIISWHPVSFFGMTIQKLFRKITFVCFIGDYFPGNSLAIRIFEGLKKKYHDSVMFSVYLSDGINKKLNGKILNTNNRKTIMWGVKKLLKPKESFVKDGQFNILFVGLIKDSQGLEFLFDFLNKYKSYSVKIIGICDNSLYARYQVKLRKLKIENRVFFPNLFYSNEKLLEIAKTCHVGVALYDQNKSNPTYYTDPGKVKSYAEMGLPVIMTNTSGIAPFITKFKSGIVINRNMDDLGKALIKMKKNYNEYITGLEKFMEYFEFKKYYREKYAFLENL